jgi:site-specific DNA-methyltransferase (adenine-specific)
MPETKIICGDVLQTLRRMQDNCVHCVVTSPPYFGLRDYGQPGQIGLEPSPQEFVAKLVEIFREVRRVLRPDGTCWLNLGDIYNSGPSGGLGGSTLGGGQENQKNSNRAWRNGSGRADGIVDERAQRNRNGVRAMGLKPKDLIGIPWRVAFALQADGWYLRQDIIWHKPNPMPESVRDRCTKAHEYLFLLTKSEKYYFDSDVIAEDVVKGAAGSTFHKGKTATHQLERSSEVERVETGKRNKRSVWTIAPKPYKEAHFATFPPDLVEPCIKAGTSEHGCCPHCAAPWVRVVERKAMVIERSERTHEKGRTRSSGTMVEPATTLGWQPTCKCPPHVPQPSIVMDIFGGAGTTGFVAKNLNRHCVLIELNPEYVKLIEKRLAPT